ncbi:PepSY-associated TM helix domain-containing protein [Aestuariibius sp. HNIBRBA575]|uniref:PepSY-associated TM helix domain-containing protein n=1 Tax=Aestuariibius sp. HNIBRBA575 TaxID=3233343 RepID=UPI0034A2943F
MTDATVSGVAASQKATGGALYRMVWKWHFLASLYVLPFMAMLAITGGIYLYKPQIEAWLYADQMNVSVGEAVLPLETLVAAVDGELGVTRLRGITVYDDPARSAMIEFNDADRVRSYAWVDPYTGDVLGSVERDRMAMRMLKKFHGELLLGKTGTKFVELAAHWAIVMFITGVYLWWPRGQRTLSKAVSLPKGEGRAWWRETHLFVGFLATIVVVPILISGLPWTDVWGGGLSYVQEQTDQKSGSLRFSRDVPGSTTSQGTPIAYADVIATAQAQGLVSPYEMRPPRDEAAAFWVRSASRDRYEQSELIVDQYSGDVLMRHDFDQNPVLAKAVSLGISLHQGELYGPLNLVVNTLAALAALFLSITGFVAWWKRRPAGRLGVPNAPDRALGSGMIVLIIFVSLLFPLVAASLIAALLLDWLIFSRLGWFRSENP